jgi:hypothetical protein
VFSDYFSEKFTIRLSLMGAEKQGELFERLAKEIAQHDQRY